MSIIERFSNFLSRRGFRDDTAEENKRQVEQAKLRAEQRQASYQAYQQKIKRQEAAEKVEQQTAKKVLSKPKYAIYKGVDVLRDIGQYTVRGTTQTLKYPTESAAYDYTKSKGYEEMQRAKKAGGVYGTISKVADPLQQVGEGVIRAVPGVPDVSYSTEQLKSRPFVVGGQLGGELVGWRAAGKLGAKAIGGTVKYAKVAKDTTKAPVIRTGAKVLSGTGAATGRVLASKPVRYASEGITGEAVDIGQAYLGQRKEIGEAFSKKRYKEVAARLAAGYAFEKAGDVAVSKGFRSGMPTKIVKGKKVADVDKFITSSGTDPKIARLFEYQTSDAGILTRAAQKTGIDFSLPSTKVDPRILAGVRTYKGTKFDLSGVRVKTIKGTKGTKGFKGEKGEKGEKMDKLIKGEKGEKLVKTKLVEPFALPFGYVPPGPGIPRRLKGTRTKLVSAKVKNLAVLSGFTKNKNIGKLI